MNTCDIVLAINHPGHVVAETVAAKKLTLERFTLTVSLAVPGMIVTSIGGKRLQGSSHIMSSPFFGIPQNFQTNSFP